MVQRDISKIDKTILENFYKLVHSQPNVRLTAAASTFKILNAFKKGEQEKFNQNLNYCIERLVGGLSSSRALARRGYGTLLLDLLVNFRVSTERLLTIGQQKFGNIGKDATKDSLLGYFLLITIIMESENFKKGKQGDQHLDKMYKYLTQLVTTKSYFDYSVSELIVRFHKDFHSSMLDCIPQHAFGSDAKLSPIELLSMVLCSKVQPIRELLNMDGATFLSICSALKSDKLQKRPLHPVFQEVSLFVIEHQPSKLETFYSTILFPTFFKANHNELATMGLELTANLIGFTSSPDAIQILLSDHVVRLLIVSLKSKKEKLYKSSLEFFASLKNHFEAMIKEDGEDKSDVDKKQCSILSRLTTPPGSLTFDKDSNSFCFSDLLNQCTANVLEKYLGRLVEFISKQTFKDSHCQILCACLRQIAFIVCRTQMIGQRDTRLRMTKFALANLFFRQSGDKGSSKSSLLRLDIHDTENERSIRSTLKNAYSTILHHIVSTYTSSERIEVFDDLIGYSDSLLKDSSLKYLNNDGKESKVSEWTDYMKYLTTFKKLVKKHKDSKQLYPVSNLFYFYGLQVFEHQLQCKTQLEELIQSATDSMEGDPKDGSWADILTDQIIAILSATECSPWIRKLCDSVFGSLLPHISPTSIDLLCDAIKAPMDGDEDPDGSEPEESDVEGDSEDAMSVDEDQEDENDKSDSEVDDSEESEESSDSFGNASSNDEEQQHNEDEKDDDDASEESEYLDDEQMMKLDTVIADMFKLNRVGKKKRLDPSFKLRCLDLIQKILVKKRNDKETVSRILETIVPLEHACRKSSETRPISEKINRILPKNSEKLVA